MVFLFDISITNQRKRKKHYNSTSVFQDREFTAQGQLLYPAGRTPVNSHLPEFFGRVILVNGQAWPKLFEPDYTAFITKMLQDRPQACYSALWAGDLVTFVEQGSLYGLFDQVSFFGINLADYTILKTLKRVPAGMHSGSRYLTNVPDSAANRAFGERYDKKYKELPTIWSQECYTGMLFLAEAVRKTGNTKSDDLVRALEGLNQGAVG